MHATFNKSRYNDCDRFIVYYKIRSVLKIIDEISYVMLIIIIFLFNKIVKLVFNDSLI